MTETTNRDCRVVAGRAAGVPLYELSHLERTFTKGGMVVKAVRGVDLVIKRGEMVSLEGPSGSGKTTLLQLLGALDSPTGGTIRFADRDLGGLNDRELTKIRAEEIGFVFQHFNLIPTLTAEENVAIAMFPNHVRSHERLARAKELLNQVGLGPRLGHLPSRLSGGEQQRVAIAGRSRTVRASSSPTSRRATSTPTPPRRSWRP